MSVLICCILLPVISYMYSLFYCRMRGLIRSDHDRKTTYIKIILCIVFNYLVMITTTLMLEISCKLQVALLEVLSGIDIHIRKIPTELLAAVCVLSIVSVFHASGHYFSILSAFLIASGYYYFRNKIGIGVYDILLIAFLGVTLPGLVIQLKFSALVLILWGIAGLSIRVLKKERDLLIPLVPLITLGYYTVQIFL